MSEKEKIELSYSTASNPSWPGSAKLEITKASGEVLFRKIFTIEEWEELDEKMRFSLGKYLG